VAVNPQAESLRIVKQAGEELERIALNDLRLRANRVLRAVDKAADTIPDYLVEEVFGATAKPSGPGWNSVKWRPLDAEWAYRKIPGREKNFFYDTSDLRRSVQSGFKTGKAFGRAYVVVNGKRPKSATNWSNININFSDPTPITMDFFPFLKAGENINPTDRAFAFQAMQRGVGGGLGRESALKLMTTPKAYRPVIEPTLIYFATKHLRAIANNEIAKQGLF